MPLWRDNPYRQGSGGRLCPCRCFSGASLNDLHILFCGTKAITSSTVSRKAPAPVIRMTMRIDNRLHRLIRLPGQFCLQALCITRTVQNINQNHRSIPHYGNRITVSISQKIIIPLQHPSGPLWWYTLNDSGSNLTKSVFSEKCSGHFNSSKHGYVAEERTIVALQYCCKKFIAILIITVIF